MSAHWPVLPGCWAQHKGHWAHSVIYDVTACEGGQWSSRPRGEGATVWKHEHLRQQSVDQNGSECPQSAGSDERWTVVLFIVVIADECVSLKASCGFTRLREEPDIGTGKWGCASFPGDPLLKSRPFSLRYESRWVAFMIRSAVIRPGKRWLSSPSRMRHWSRVWRCPIQASEDEGGPRWVRAQHRGSRLKLPSDVWTLTHSQRNSSTSWLTTAASCTHAWILQNPATFVQKNLPKVCWATAKKKKPFSAFSDLTLTSHMQTEYGCSLWEASTVIL